MPAPDDDAAAIEPVDTFEAVRNARRRHGAAGAILAAGMLGLDEALGLKVKQEAPIVITASDKPVDIDDEGITVPVDEAMSILAPPQPRSAPLTTRRRRRRS
jgi:hypothetical protein